MYICAIRIYQLITPLKYVYFLDNSCKQNKNIEK